MARKQKTLLIILLVVFSAVFIISGAVLLRQYFIRERDGDTFDELAEMVMLSDISEEILYGGDVYSSQTDTEESPDFSGEAETKKPIIHKRDLTPLISRNEHCVGWVFIEDTKVNYPVMHTPDNPEKYLNLSFDLKYSVYGVPFLDYRCTLDSDNLIIYGHNINDGSMFGSIRKYIDKEYFSSHPYIEFETVEGCKTYRIFAVSSVKSVDPWYSYSSFSDPAQYSKNIERIMSKSLYETGVTPEYGKKIITLSTCYGAARDDRLLLIAVEE